MTKNEKQVLLDHINTDSRWYGMMKAFGDETAMIRHWHLLMRLKHLAGVLELQLTSETKKGHSELYGDYKYEEYYFV